MALLGAPTSTSHIANSLEANLRRAFLDKMSRLKSYRNRYYNVTREKNLSIIRDTMNAAYGTYAPLAQGAVPDYDSGQEAWTKSYSANEFALGVEVTRIALEDDYNGVIRWLMKRGGALADVANYTMERDSLDLFNTYLTSGTAYSAGGSNYSVLSTTHFRVDGGTMSNRPANDMDLSMEALEFAVAHWQVNQVNQRGQVIGNMPQKLLVGANDWSLAKRLLDTKLRATSADNDINTVGDVFSELIVHPLLTNDGRWLAFAPKEDLGTVYWERRAPGIASWPDGDNGNKRMVGSYREAHGLTHPQGIFGSA